MSRKRELSRKVRQRILDRDGWRCQQCGAAGRLEVHHIKRWIDGGEDNPDNLETLCRLCHIRIHQPPVDPKRQEWRDLVRLIHDAKSEDHATAVRA